MKIGIVGLGSVGGAVATAAYNTGLIHEMVLIDRNPLRARAAAEDLGHAAAFGFDINIHSGGYRDLKGAEIVIIAAGQNQKIGESRTDLLKSNAAVIRDIVPQIMKNADADNIKLIVVTNPLDVMVMQTLEISGLSAGRVIGTGTMLDSARLRALLSKQLSVSPASINAYVLGEHGDSSVLNWSAATIGNLPLQDFCRQTKIAMTAAVKKTTEHRVRNAANEIIKGRGATWDGIGAAAADLVRAIANDEKRILTVSKMEKDVAMSLPRIVGADGVTATLMPRLDANESAALKNSAAIIRKNFSDCA
ncbi:MAG: NAD(P)-binding domain-containing protein [Rickettsiales bacterium]|jgi:L-lactate dehydrogenase|nr:NAD(P)-binding domain-containing protein [Rickettsiales bacterium]